MTTKKPPKTPDAQHAQEAPQTPTGAKTPELKPFRVGGIDERFLIAMNRYHYLTAKQLTTLLYKPGNLTTVQARLKRLTDAGYLIALSLPTIKAKSPYVYTLGTKGRNYLTDLGIEVALSSFRPSKEHEHEHNYAFFTHILQTSDVLIAAEVLARTTPGVRLSEVLHDLTIKHDPPTLASKGKKSTATLSLVPDGWLRFHIEREDAQGEGSVGIWLELDRGTVEIKPLKRKVSDLIALYEGGGYKAHFDTKSALFCFATTAGVTRRELLRKWIREEVERLQAPGWWVQRFAVTALPSELDPQELFFGNVWWLYKENTKPVALLTKK